MPVKSSWKKRIAKWILPVVFAISLFYPQPPYYIMQPGSADELAPLVTVEGGKKEEKGAIMLTTVYTIPTRNIYYLAYGYLAPHSELLPKQSVDQGLPQDEYTKILQQMMDSSQQNAMVAGFRAAGKKVDITNLGVEVVGILDQSKAKGVLQKGDLIQQIDTYPVHQAEDVIRYLSGKKPGDKVQVTFTRNGKKEQAEIECIALPSDPSSGKGPRTGLGIQQITKQEIHFPAKVSFHTENIGGPSAGLMFATEIVSQLTPGDLTKGYKIAGTGTIDIDGHVGQIGGIEHKVVAADRKGAEIFFVPADINKGDDNAAKAKQTAEEIHSSMKIVPVRTLADVLAYLRNLPPHP
jgi:Lon-like protease